MAELTPGLNQRGDACARASGSKGEEQTHGDGSNRLTAGTAVAGARETVEEKVFSLMDREAREKQNEDTVVMSGVEQMFHDVGRETGGTSKISAVGGHKELWRLIPGGGGVNEQRRVADKVEFGR